MKKLILFFNLLFLFSCTSVSKKDFSPVKKIYNDGFKFQTGDILILKKQPNFYSIFGHSAIVLDNGKVGEYPAYGYGYIEIGLSDWLESSLDRDIIVLRADLSENQKLNINNSVWNYSSSKYGVINKKMGTDEFYCSSFIWRVYYDLGIDLDKEFKLLVMPYDFLETSELKKIKEEN